MDKKELKEFNDNLDKDFYGKLTPVKIAFNKIKTRIDKNNKKLKVIGWIATCISLIGIIFNAYKMIICWPIWCVANLFWIYWATKKKEWSQVILWSIFTLANIYGWYMWYIN